MRKAVRSGWRFGLAGLLCFSISATELAPTHPSCKDKKESTLLVLLIRFSLEVHALHTTTESKIAVVALLISKQRGKMFAVF